MGTYTDIYNVSDRTREARRRRLQVLAYAGLAVLAVVTCAVVGLALQR